MEELLQEMRENILILMETAEVLEKQIQRLKDINPGGAQEFVEQYQEQLKERNVAIESERNEKIEQPDSEAPVEHSPYKRKKSIMSKI